MMSGWANYFDLGQLGWPLPRQDRIAVLTDGDYRVVFDASPDAMLIVDADGVIQDLNPQAVSMFGWSRDEMEGSSVEQLVPVISRTRHRRHRRHYGEAPRVRPMGKGLELLALHRDGTTIPVEISLSPGKLASGQEHVICTVRDITGWKRMRHVSRMMVTAAENERKRLSRELHDGFLQSLVAVKIRVKLLADEASRHDRERTRVQIADEIQDTILGVKRVIRELLPPELEHHRLASALGSVFRHAHEVYGLTVHASLDRVDGEVDAAAALALYRIVQEAVNNAARHAGVHEATVTLRSAGDMIVAENPRRG
jgi:PAS domain S-box-containing protein